jgi:hypothetical protein
MRRAIANQPERREENTFLQPFWFAKDGTNRRERDMADNFDTMGDSPELPSRVPFALVPSDSVPLTQVVKGIYVGTGGDVTLRGVGGASDVTYRNLPNASYIGVRASFVRATGTTASDLIGEA